MDWRFQGIDHVQLAAPPNCEEAARRFYGECLGLEEVPKPAELQKRGGVWFRLGNQEVHIGVQDPFVPATKAHPAFLVTSLALLKQRLAEYGAEIIEDAPIEGRERFFTHDPSGNRIEFLEYK
jgi:catechol 2,3-dioxygenase-like lactoylglutathione lyase family enzyme